MDANGATPPTTVASGPPSSGRVGAGRSDTIHTAFSPRRNGIPVLRLALAGIVAVAHALDTGYGARPVLARTDVADLAVDAFFVLSGFLVARSYVRLGSWRRYAWHRFLRIMPGFWACLVLTAVVAAPLAAVLLDRSPTSVFTTAEDPAWRYVVANAGLAMVQFEIGGIAAPSGEPVFDGALWTLAYEAFCYGVVVVLGVLALRRGRRGAVLALIVAVWAAAVLQHLGLIPVDVPVFDNRDLFRFLLVFLLGVAGFLYADRIVVRWELALASVLVLALTVQMSDYRLLGALCFAYLCLYLVVRSPLRQDPAWDLSYGVYIYHWPVQFVALLAGWTVLPAWAFVVVTIAITCLLAAASWLLVEQPALRLKNAPWPGRRRQRTVAAER